jgi:hypothetical protein
MSLRSIPFIVLSFLFTLSATAQTTASFTGTWSGTMQRACADQQSVAMYNAVATLQQSGSTITGTLTATGSNTCVAGSPSRTYTIPINGTVSETVFIAEFSVAGATNGVIVGVLSGGFMGIAFEAFDENGVEFGLSGAFTSGIVTPGVVKINAFFASPQTIRAGQTATLSWSVDGASSVSIDNGIGHVPSVGSREVSPSGTTTYTLIAQQGTTTATATTTVTVLTGPVVNVTMLPAAMLQPAGTAGATTSYSLTNSGSTSTSITLTQSGNFFTQSPTTFTLAPGATQTITITATAQSAGSFDGASIPSGSGVPSGLQVPVKLLSAAAPTGTVNATSPAPRVDVSAPVSSSPTGSVQFTNTGNATLTGILSSDVPWIIPQTGVVTIAPGATATFTFTIDRTKRPDSSSPIGSVEGNLILSFLGGTGSAFAKRPLDGPSTTPSVSIVRVVDTAQPTVTTAGIPALATGEVALFVAGAGHVVGTTGAQFVSDVNVLNALGGGSIDDIKMYYTASSGSTAAAKTTSLGSVPGRVSVQVADVVKSVFSGTNEVGTVQIRSKDADKLAVAATVLSTNSPNGIYGNTIPVFRSDRAVGASNTIVLTGLRKDATTHTNLYIQETAGFAASVQTDFFGADGSSLGSRTDAIDAFKMVQLVNVVPSNAVSAVITNNSTAGGKIAAYATPVDETSSDTWAVADWSRQFGYAGSETVIVPVAGSVHGANNTFFRTDVAITNRGTSTATGTLRYISRTGSKTDRVITLSGRQTTVMSDVIGSTFNVSGDTTGYLTFIPSSGAVAITSRTFTTGGSSTATFGTGVPVMAASSALRAGGVRPIAGLSDSSRQTVIAARPATFRTNFALMETSGQRTTVRVTFRFTFPAGEKAQGVGSAYRDYTLNGNQFVLLNSIASEVLGPARLQFGDLSNVEADFQVIDGIGSVMTFTSSVDNSSGDSILRTE